MPKNYRWNSSFSPNIDKSDFLYITAKNIKKDGLDLSKISYVTKEIHNEIFSRCNPEREIFYILKMEPQLE